MATVSSPWVKHILQTAEQFSISRAELLLKAPLQPIRIGELERYALDDVVTLWHAAIELSGAEDFGLRMGSTMTPAHLNIVSYIVLNSPTLLAGLEKAQRYYRLISDGGQLSIELGAKDSLLIYTPHPDHHKFHVQQIDAALATLNTVLSWALGKQYQPIEILLQRPEPDNGDTTARDGGSAGNAGAISSALFQPYFDCPISYAQKHCAIRISNELFELEQLNDSGLGQLHEEFAEKLLKTLSESSWKQRVQALIEPSLSQGEINREKIAQQLNVSARTLQRRLSGEGCQFQDVVDELRLERARDYLSQAEMSQEDIAELLGYAEPSAFYRAFKRWTGMTPKEYQQSL